MNDICTGFFLDTLWSNPMLAVSMTATAYTTEEKVDALGKIFDVFLATRADRDPDNYVGGGASNAVLHAIMLELIGVVVNRDGAPPPQLSDWFSDSCFDKSVNDQLNKLTGDQPMFYDASLFIRFHKDKLFRLVGDDATSAAGALFNKIEKLHPLSDDSYKRMVYHAIKHSTTGERYHNRYMGVGEVDAAVAEELKLGRAAPRN